MSIEEEIKALKKADFDLGIWTGQIGAKVDEVGKDLTSVEETVHSLVDMYNELKRQLIELQEQVKALSNSG